ADGARCGCGHKGHLEAYVSKTAIERQIRKAIAKGKPCSLTEKLMDHVGPLKSSWLAKAYNAGDPVIKKAIDRSARYLGYGIASFINILNPEMVILGGGVVEALQEKYIDQVIRVTQANIFPVAFQNVKIIPAALGDNAGLLGASVLACQALKK
ncbi:ROK family protein, partial [bacterium]|nr:ROK family protein [bacterium]